MPQDYCNFCIGHPILDAKHIRSRQHTHNIRKLPMEPGQEWWTMKKEDLFNYLNKNSIEKHKNNLPKQTS